MKLSGSVFRRINQNSGGVFQPTPTRRAMLTLDDVVTGDPTSVVSAQVWSPHICIVVNLKGAEYAGFKVEFAAQTTYSDDIRASFIMPFWVMPFGWLDSNGWAIEDRPGVVMDESADLIERPVEIGPARRIMEMQFADPADLTQFNGPAADADYMLASANANAEGVAQLFDTMPNIAGMMRQSNGRDPVLWLAQVDKIVSGSDVTVLRSYGREFMLCTATGPVRQEHMFGRFGNVSSDDWHGEVIRGGRLALREVT